MDTKKGLIFLLFALCIPFFCSCNERRTKINEEVKQMLNEKIDIRIKDMKVFNKSGSAPIINKDSTSIPNYRYILYFDSTECTACAMNRLAGIKTIKKRLRRINANVTFLLIFDDPGNTDKFQSEYYSSGLDEPVYLDVKHLLKKKKSNVPQEKYLQSFMLDKNNNVVLVGNPLTNDNIEKLLYQYLSKDHSKQEWLYIK